MGRLIVSAQVAVDCVMDRLGGQFDPEGEAGAHALELLKREGYGRAGFDLLRARMLAA